MSGVSEQTECDEVSGSVEGDTDLVEEDEEEGEESESNKELLERLRELEAENASLALANESQREAYERCLDEVANHVVQALLNQKDLREECIKLKMRVFDLERQNQTLTDFLTHRLHFSSSPVNQLSSVSCADHRSDPSLNISKKPDTIPCQRKATGGDHTQTVIDNPTQSSSSSSLEAMSPFLKKKAHILEVLRKLEESDPLKIHLSACHHHHQPHHLHPQIHETGDMTSTVVPRPHQHQCRQSSSDPDLHEHHLHGEEHQENHLSFSFSGCPTCLIVQQRSNLEMIKDDQGLPGSPRSPKDEKNPEETNSEDPEKISIKRQSSPKSKSTPKYEHNENTDTEPSIMGSPNVEKKKESLKVLRESQTQDPEITNSASRKSLLGSSYSSSSLPERSTSALSQQQKKSTQSLFGESKPSASTLLKLLKVPSENISLSGSPQVARKSKIPCRNKCEIHTRTSNMTEQNFSHPSSPPTSPPNPEEPSLAPEQVSRSKASKSGAQEPHYENLVGSSSSIEVPEKEKFTQSDEILDPQVSSDSSTSTSDSSSSSSSSEDQETDTESPVWQRSLPLPQHHFSLPNSSPSTNKTQRMSYHGIEHRPRDGILVASPKCFGSSGVGQVMDKRRQMTSSEMSYHPFKERLVVLGRVQNENGVLQGGRKGPTKGETEVERKVPELRKHAGSLKGKTSTKNSFGNYAKVQHASSPSSSSSERRYITKPESQKIRTTSSCETLVLMRKYGKCSNPLNKTVTNPHSSPSRGQSRSPSKPGNSSSANPRGMKPVQEEHQDLQKHQKKKTSHLNTFACPKSVPQPHSAKSAQEERISNPQSSIEQKVMQGIQENVLKLQDQDREHVSETTKQKTSSGLASWFGLKKSKLPALTRKPENSKIKPMTSIKPATSSLSPTTKDVSGTRTGSRQVVESLNISNLMEKAEDLRKALEDERVYVKGVGIPLDRSARGRSCEVIVEQSQGPLSLMYAGVTGDGFMQQLLNRVDDQGTPGFGIMHRRLSFDSKRSRPVFGYQQSGVRQTRSGEEIKCSAVTQRDDVMSNESLVESVSSQHFKGSMRTLDSGIGTFPLPVYSNNPAGKLNPKPNTSSVPHHTAIKPRKTRPLEGALTCLEEVNTSLFYTSPLQTKGTTVHMSSTIHEDIDVYGAHFQTPPTANWSFPKPRGSEGRVESPNQQTTKTNVDKVPPVPCVLEARNVSPSGGRRGRGSGRSHGTQDMAKNGNADLTKERSEDLLSPNRPQVCESPESLSDSLYDSLSSCGSQG